MYQIEDDVFEALPDEAKSMIEKEGQKFEVEMPDVLTDEGFEATPKLHYGKGGKYDDEMKFEDKVEDIDEGKIKEYGDEGKEDIKDFDMADERGLALIKGMGRNKRKGR